MPPVRAALMKTIAPTPSDAKQSARARWSRFVGVTAILYNQFTIAEMYPEANDLEGFGSFPGSLDVPELASYWDPGRESGANGASAGEVAGREDSLRGLEHSLESA